MVSKWLWVALVLAIAPRIALTQDEGSDKGSKPELGPLLPRQLGVGSSSCAISDDFHIWCFGSNTAGELGVGVPVPSYATPSMAVDLGPWMAVTQGDALTCALRTDGSPWCWGNLGIVIPGTNATYSPTMLKDVASPWATITVGADTICGVTTDGKAYCLGANGSGQLGDGGTNSTAKPVEVLVPSAPAPPPPPSPPPPPPPSPPDKKKKKDDYSEEDYAPPPPPPESAYGDGSGYGSPPPPDGTYADASPPLLSGAYDTQPPPAPIDASYGLSPLPEVDPNTAYERFGGGYGSEEESASTSDQSGTPPPARRRYRRARSLLRHLTQDPAAVGPVDPAAAAVVPVAPPVDPNAVPVVVDPNAAAVPAAPVIDPVTGAPVVVDPNSVAAAAAPPPAPVPVPSPPPPPPPAGPPVPWIPSGAGGWRSISAAASDGAGGGPRHTCGVTADSRILCWGDNSQGQLGDGTLNPRSIPATVLSNSTAFFNETTNATTWGWSSVAAGPGYTCGISWNGTLLCWGRHPGRLADKKTRDDPSSVATAPEVIWSDGEDPDEPPYTVWKSISAGPIHACGLIDSGSALCFGLNTDGILGDGGKRDASVPVEAYGPGAWSAVAAGTNHTCGIDEEGTMLCWGEGSAGKLGTGLEEESREPIAVATPPGQPLWGVRDNGTPLPESPLIPAPPRAPPTPLPPPPPPPAPESDDGGTSVGLVAGATAVAVLAAVGIAGGTWWYIRRRRARAAAAAAGDASSDDAKFITPRKGSFVNGFPADPELGTAPASPFAGETPTRALSRVGSAAAVLAALPESHRLAMSGASRDALVRWLSQTEASPGPAVTRWVRAWLATPAGSQPAPALSAPLNGLEFQWGDVEVAQGAALGMGSFGAVCLGRWRDGKERVAGQQLTAVKLLVDAKTVVERAKEAGVERAGSVGLGSPAALVAASRRGSHSSLSLNLDDLPPGLTSPLTSPKGHPVSPPRAGSGSLARMASLGAPGSPTVLPPLPPAAGTTAGSDGGYSSGNPSPRFDELVATAPSVAITPRETLIAHAMALAAVPHHPNVLGFEGVCQRPPALAFEFCARGSLFDVLHAGQTAGRPAKGAADLTWAVTVRIAAGAAAGMAHLHARAPVVLHKALKSTNVLIAEDWTAKIADYGAAELAVSAAPADATAAAGDTKLTKGNSASVSSPTSAAKTAGDPRWLAPELIEGSPATPATDVFAFGIVLWELLTWQSPWANLSPWSVVGLVLSGARPLVPTAEALPALAGGATARPGLDAYLTLMQRCWAQRPAQRPKSAEIVAALEGLAV